MRSLVVWSMQIWVVESTKNASHYQGIEGSEQEVEHLLPSAEASIVLFVWLREE